MDSQESCENHRLCTNGCGFFGSPATLNLCSKCYSDFRMKEEQSASAKAAVEKSLNPPLNSPSPMLSESKIDFSPPPSSSSAPGSGCLDAGKLFPPDKEANGGNRCGRCGKRVGLTGFRCRCGSTFCGSHRHPEEHGCGFDFKGAGREAIARANPVVRAEKLQRI